MEETKELRKKPSKRRSPCQESVLNWLECISLDELSKGEFSVEEFPALKGHCNTTNSFSPKKASPVKLNLSKCHLANGKTNAFVFDRKRRPQFEALRTESTQNHLANGR